MPQLNNLRRSTKNGIIAGVCAGIAEWLGWKRVTVRAWFIIGSFVPIIPGFIVYLVLWAMLPEKSRQKDE